MKILKLLYRGFQRLGLWIGNIISTIILTVFYFSIFALFAIPYRLFAKPLGVKSANSNWIKRVNNLSGLDDLKSE